MDRLDKIMEMRWFVWVLIVGSSALYLSIEVFLSGFIQEALKFLVLFGFVFGLVRYGQIRRQIAKREPGRENDTRDASSDGLGEFNEEQEEEKEARKQHILEILQERDHVDNDIVQEELDVSHATAARYLSELEQEGEIRQEGDAGKHVFYMLPGSENGDF